MAQRRMFSKSVLETDLFMFLPTSAKLLYFVLGMNADDDGVIANVHTLMAIYGLVDSDLELLLGNRYLLDLGDGVFVITHWLRNNQIRRDRYKHTVFSEKFAGLSVVNNLYVFHADAAQTNVSTGQDNIEGKQQETPIPAESGCKDQLYEDILCYYRKMCYHFNFDKFFDYYFKKNSGRSLDDYKKLADYWEQHEFNRGHQNQKTTPNARDVESCYQNLLKLEAQEKTEAGQDTV